VIFDFHPNELFRPVDLFRFFAGDVASGSEALAGLLLVATGFDLRSGLSPRCGLLLLNGRCAFPILAGGSFRPVLLSSKLSATSPKLRMFRTRTHGKAD
jgi:hypothetical protein